MTPHDPRFDELAAGALLDDLDPGELERFEMHQAGCTRCAALTSDLRMTLGDLALAAPPRRPPDALAATVLASVTGASSPAPGTPAFPVPSALPTAPTRPGGASRPARLPAAPTGRSWWDRLTGRPGDGARLAPVAAGLVVLTLLSGAWGLTTRAELDRVSASAADARGLADAEARAMDVAMAPDHATVTLHPEPLAPTAQAIVLYRPGHPEAYLVARDLPATPSGKVYQLWVADGTGVHGLATYHYGGSGPFIAAVGRDLAGSTAVMVTLEPDGGALGEPGPQVVFGTL